MMKLNNTVALGENVATTGAAVQWRGGKGVFVAKATWNAGTAKLQQLCPDAGAATWIDVKNPAGTAVSLSADGMIYFELPPGSIRVNIATSTAVYAYACGIQQ